MSRLVSYLHLAQILPIFLNLSMSDWYVSFEEILAEHKDDFLAAKDSQSTCRRQVLRNVRDTIVDICDSQDDPVDLPKALKRVMLFT